LAALGPYKEEEKEEASFHHLTSINTREILTLATLDVSVLQIT
jgi:hypothetical protein